MKCRGDLKRSKRRRWMKQSDVLDVSKRFVMVDRDGTLNVEKNYLSTPDQLELIPGAGEALQRLQDAGWGICVVSNQSGIARGYFDMEQVGKVHQRLEQMLEEFDVHLDGIYLCPHAPAEGCSCRKPLPGMMYQAMAAHGFNPQEAWVIGDKEVDVEFGHAVSAHSILVLTGYGKHYQSATKADHIANDLAAAVGVILDAQRKD
jgi:D-glycero-D-manno-heptose 1,7-bisphosphate phosphatase